MSRGLGTLQRYLFQAMRHSGKPLTFAEIVETAYPPEPDEYLPVSWEIRSLRRALYTMVEDNGIIRTGEGGPADPYRYCINPMIIGSDDQSGQRVT
jgi:hypothetical protein